MLQAWSEIAVESADFYIAWGGLLIGIAFGFIVYRTNFCTMGSISDILSFGDWSRFRAWILAMAVAMLGVWLIEGSGVGDMTLFTVSAILLLDTLAASASIARQVSRKNRRGCRSFSRRLLTAMPFLPVAGGEWWPFCPVPLLPARWE